MDYFQISLLLLVLILTLLVLVWGVYFYFLIKNSGSQKSLDYLYNSIQKLWSKLDYKVDSSTQNLDYKIADTQKILSKNLNDSLDFLQKNTERSENYIENLTKKLTEIENTNKAVKDIASKLEGLENILKNPKQRGNLGEYFLSELLANVFQEKQYTLQYQLGTNIVDAALFLSDIIIPIDAKFPQENYQNFLHSEHEVDKKIYAKQLKNDIKKRIDETTKYIHPELWTSDFAFMLIPAEWMYYDIFIAKLQMLEARELIEYAFTKKVIICSPSSFYAYLQTVIQGMKSLKIEQDVEEIKKYVAKLQKDLEKYEQHFSALGRSINAVQNHYEKAEKRLQIIDTDIYKITDGKQNDEKEI